MEWNGSRKKDLTPSIVAIVGHFNQIAIFVTGMILSATKIQTRLSIVGYFIHVANVLLNLNKTCLLYENYDGLRSILSGLQATPVHRLHRTWALLGRVERELLAKMEEITSINNNNEKYRQRLAASTAPYIPYLGINLSDLTYIWECVKKDKENNARKAQYKERQTQFSQLLDEIGRMQTGCNYRILTDNKFRDALTKAMILPNDDINVIYDNQFILSNELEPKETNTVAERESLEWKFTTMKIKDFKVPQSLRHNPMNSEKGKPLHSLPSRGSEIFREVKIIPRKQRQRVEANIFVPPNSEPSIEEEIPVLPVKVTPIKKKMGFLAMLGFTKKRAVSSTSKESNVSIRNRSQSQSRSSVSKAGWEKNGKFVLQGMLYKKEEFDEAGTKSRGHWKPYWVTLDGTCLSMTPFEMSKGKEELKMRKKAAPRRNLVSLANLFPEKDPNSGHGEIKLKTVSAGDLLVDPPPSIKKQNSISRWSVSPQVFIINSPKKLVVTEKFQLNNLTRINKVEEHRRPFVFRAMLQEQRSFLLRGSSDLERDLYITSIRAACLGPKLP